MQHDPRGPGGEYPRQYPTPQTDSLKVVSPSSRLWNYLYNDPRGMLLLISAIIGTVYLVIKVVDAILLYNSTEAVLIAQAVNPRDVLPSMVWAMTLSQLPMVHYVTIIMAVVANWLSYFIKRPWIALLAAILYLVCGISYIRWIAFVLPEIILLAIGYFALVRRYDGWL